MNDSPQLIWRDLAKVDVGKKLINQFAMHEKIPNKWFDWESNLEKKDIVIVGQDWGPYSALLRYIEDLRLAEEWTAQFSSRTEKFLLNTLSAGFGKRFGKKMEKEDWERIFFTVAVLFCRSGNLFRGSANFEEKLGMRLSLPFLKRQLEIVKPRVVLCLGKLAQRQMAEIGGKYKIVDSFHPAAHVDPKIIRKSIESVWKYV